MRWFAGFIVCVAALTPGLALAQTAPGNDALLEACNALPDPAKRLQCFKQAAGAPAITVAPESALLDSFAALDGQINQGISLVNYNQAILVPAKELALFERNNPAADQRAIGAFKAALMAYNNASRFWKASISASVRDRGIFTSSTMTMDDMVTYGVSDLNAVYHFPTRATGPFGAWTGVSREDGLSTIWAAARSLHDRGAQIMAGKLPASTTAPSPQRDIDPNRPALPTKACPQDVIDRMRADGLADSAINLSCGG